MRFSNTVSIPAPADELFALVSDIERIAPCLPGAAVEGREGDGYRGTMKVRVGPITASYAGTLRFVELDAEQRRAVLSAKAEETRGSGGVEAEITTSITADGAVSLVQIDTELQISGRIAQLGRGPMEKISERMLQEFAQNLERQLLAPEAEEPPAAQSAPEEASAPRTVAPPVAPLALVDPAQLAEVRAALLPGIAGGLIGYVVARLLSRLLRR
jgi:carbon monoxide dehydrogenase subunit G